MKAISVKAKRFATTIVVMAICFIIAVPVHAAYSLRTVTIKVFQDQSYLDTYSYHPDYIETTMRRVAYPFKNKWNISLKPSYYNVWGMPLEDCPNGYYAGCDNSNCGSTCVNKFQTKNHHKNFNYNTLFARRSYDYVDFDLALVVSGANLCHINDEGIHSTGCLGWTTSIGGDFMMVKQNEERGDIQNVRVIQHELSHAFKCEHHDDTTDCIMTGGFDENKDYNLSSIWCSQCENKFKRTQH